MAFNPRHAHALTQMVSAIHSFYLAMTVHPEVQRKAQVEIDRVIGNDRFPTLADQSSLPYVDALVKEVLRWNPVAPLGKLAVFRGYELSSLFVPREADCRDTTRGPTRCCRGRRLRGVFHSRGSLAGRKHLVSKGRKGKTSLKFFFNLPPPPR